MKYLMILLAFACACDDGDADTAEVRALKAECHDVLQHIVSVSPQATGGDASAITASLPVEDIGACVASEPEIRACMVAAKDVATVKKCIPTNEVLACMLKSAKAKKQAAKKAGSGAAVDDKSFDDIRAKCWAGDDKAADSLKVE